MPAPLVSILIPVYNRESIITETVESARRQTYENIEIIIVDNASTDRTYDVLRRLALIDDRIKLFRNDVNVGPVRNWLRCVEEATGMYGKILWSDDLIADDFIEQTLPALRSDVAFVFTDVITFEGEVPTNGKCQRFMARTCNISSSAYLRKALFVGEVPCSPGCALFRMSDIRENLLLDVPNRVGSDFSMHAIGNDLLLYLMSAIKYKNCAYIAKPLSFFRSHGGSITISSNGCKIPLHYALAQAYFVENYVPKEVEAFAVKLRVLLHAFSDAERYGISCVSDFFIRDRCFGLRSFFVGFVSYVFILRFSVFRKGRVFLMNRIVK